MNIENGRDFLMYCSITNYAVLLLWYVWFAFGHDSMKKVHHRFMGFMGRKIEHFDTIHYFGMSIYKIGILLFNIVPWIALTMVNRS